MSEKQRLIEIRRAQRPPITSQQVANAAHVLLCREFLIEVGGLVHKEEAETVLAAFSQLTGGSYTLENVLVNIKSEKQQGAMRGSKRR